MDTLNGLPFSVLENYLKDGSFFLTNNSYNDIVRLDCRISCSDCPWESNCIVGPLDILQLIKENLPEYFL